MLERDIKRKKQNRKKQYEGKRNGRCGRIMSIPCITEQERKTFGISLKNLLNFDGIFKENALHKSALLV